MKKSSSNNKLRLTKLKIANLSLNKQRSLKGGVVTTTGPGNTTCHSDFVACDTNSVYCTLQ